MTYFVRIKEPQELKTTLLESARDAIILLRGHEVIKPITAQKKALIKDIHKDLESIKKMLDELHVLLTNTDTKKEVAKDVSELVTKNHVDELPEIKITEKKSVKTKSTDDDLERLEKTLDKIEEKLKNLS